MQRFLISVFVIFVVSFFCARSIIVLEHGCFLTSLSIQTKIEAGYH